MTWKTYRICPAARHAETREFYAPTLADAFAQARTRWPLSALTYLGAKS